MAYSLLAEASSLVAWTATILAWEWGVGEDMTDWLAAANFVGVVEAGGEAGWLLRNLPLLKREGEGTTSEGYRRHCLSLYSIGGGVWEK
ncbi:hypothetical protein ACLOJK_033943 [Asimina triloba]